LNLKTLRIWHAIKARILKIRAGGLTRATKARTTRTLHAAEGIKAMQAEAQTRKITWSTYRIQTSADRDRL
jgi:hypothetical protein